MGIRERKGYTKKFVIISIIVVLFLAISILLASQNLLTPNEDKEDVGESGGIEQKPGLTPKNESRYSLNETLNLEELLRLDIQYRVLEDSELYVKALEYLRKVGIPGTENLSIEDIAILEVKVILWNGGDKKFYVFSNGYCSGSPPYIKGSIYNWTDIDVDMYKEFFWEIHTPVTKLKIQVESGEWYAPAIVCTLDLRTYLVDVDDRYVSTYLFIVSKPFKGVFKAEVVAGILPYESYYQREFSKEVVIEISR